MKKIDVTLSVDDEEAQKLSPYSNYNVLWMPSEERSIIDDKFIIVGHCAVHYYTRNRGTSLGTVPKAFLIRKVSPKGKVSKQLFRWGFEDKKSPVPYALQKEFWEYFPTLAAYAIYDRHQLAIAEENVDAYCGYGWTSPPDNVCRWMNKNKYFWDMSSRHKAEREERIAEARNRILATQAQWYADDDMSAKFDCLMAPKAAPASPSFMDDLRKIDRQINKLKNEIFRAHKYENMSSECLEAKKLEQEFNALAQKHYRDIPKNSFWGSSFCILATFNFKFRGPKAAGYQPIDNPVATHLPSPLA